MQKHIMQTKAQSQITKYKIGLHSYIKALLEAASWAEPSGFLVDDAIVLKKAFSGLLKIWGWGKILTLKIEIITEE